MVWGLYHKTFTAVINSVTWKASVFVKASKKWLTIVKALYYFTTGLITAVKSFMIQALGPMPQYNLLW
jgi:hypothetical protein